MGIFRGRCSVFFVIAVITVFLSSLSVVDAKDVKRGKKDIRRKYAQSLLELKVKGVELKKTKKRLSNLEKEVEDLKAKLESSRAVSQNQPAIRVQNPPAKTKKIISLKKNIDTSRKQKRKVPFELKMARRKILLLDDSMGAMSVSSETSVRARYHLKSAEESFARGNDREAVEHAEKSIGLSDQILSRLDVLGERETAVVERPVPPQPGSIIPGRKKALENELESVYIPEKVDINSASEDALIQFLGIKKSQARNIIWYRQTVGKISFVEELGIVPGLTMDVVERISPRIIFK